MERIRLAPLCGVTDHVYRTLCFEQGCESAYTEMISAMGYLCAPNQPATRELMIRGENEPRLILQLFGKDPDVVAEAAGRIAALGIYDGIDLNMGCPAHKVASSGEGAGMMLTPDKAWRMMEKTVKAVDLPVSAKMRTGWDEARIDVIEYALMAQEAGIREITIHGRTRTQQYAGQADWEIIREVKRRVAIPVIGNGDLTDAKTALERIADGYADEVMIGRGAMGNPWIFRDCRRIENGEEPEPVAPEERRRVIRMHYERMLASRPQHVAVREMRKFIAWYLHGMRGASRIRVEINRINDPGEALGLLEQFFAGTGMRDETGPWSGESPEN